MAPTPRGESPDDALGPSLDAALAGAREGDDQAFAALYRACQPALLRYVRVLVGESADDVAAETWAQVVRDLHRFRGDADGFRGWLLTMGRNRALDLLRGQGRRPSSPMEPDQLPEPPAVLDAGALAEEALATRRALDLIAALPRDQAEAVLLHVVLGLDGPSAAKVLGKRPGAVRMAASRGLATLRARLEAERV